MHLSEADFEGALKQAELADQLRAFLAREHRGKPLLAAWNQSSLDLLGKALGLPPSKLSLKSAYRSVYGADVKELHEAIEARGLRAAPNAFQGRASQRIAHALAIARHLHERALGKIEEP
jgi:hypothetical protein